ncbi:MAG: phosphatidylserine/phosphatidylglycerophosphate/cardiolipin synthase family protein [Elusimicrobia bacterium]|nr:phosphatidylserine/phosphatidylglycerophosphate/cardiolipin synthase family protein [Elusimicrobiota bacterium]
MKLCGKSVHCSGFVSGHLTPKKYSIPYLAFLLLLQISFVFNTHAAAASEPGTTPFDTELIFRTAVSPSVSYMADIPMPKEPVLRIAPEPAEQKRLAGEFSGKIVEILRDNWYNPTAAARKIVIAEMGRAQAAGVLEPTLVSVLSNPAIRKLLPENYRESLIKNIVAELEITDSVPGIQGGEPWPEMAARQLKMVKAGSFAPRGPGQNSLFLEPGFIAEFEKLTGAAFSGANSAELLINGPASFAMREKLIKNAKKSIHILSWAVFDDTTGNWLVELLSAKKKQGLEIKVMVDEQVAALYGDKSSLPRLKAVGIELIRFRDPARKFDGLHAKLLVVDGKYAISGGMNFGDEYSHMGNMPKWRDTDVLISGPAVEQAEINFRSIWTEQAKVKNLSFQPFNETTPAYTGGSSRVSYVFQQPAKESYVFLGILKAIYGASTRINIENAYVVNTPALKQALKDAVKRGVEVNILTNSKDSVDDPIMAVPILTSLADLLRSGARIYLKQGAMVHSKFMTVDGVFCGIGSFNLHPRSIRLETEMIANIIDPVKTGELDDVFYRDAAAAKRISTRKDLGIPMSPVSWLAEKCFFNQL